MERAGIIFKMCSLKENFMTLGNQNFESKSKIKFVMFLIKKIVEL